MITAAIARSASKQSSPSLPLRGLLRFAGKSDRFDVLGLA
jgi:hypothetical protein